MFAKSRISPGLRVSLDAVESSRLPLILQMRSFCDNDHLKSIAGFEKELTEPFIGPSSFFLFFSIYRLKSQFAICIIINMLKTAPVAPCRLDFKNIKYLCKSQGDGWRKMDTKEKRKIKRGRNRDADTRGCRTPPAPLRTTPLPPLPSQPAALTARARVG